MRGVAAIFLTGALIAVFALPAPVAHSAQTNQVQIKKRVLPPNPCYGGRCTAPIKTPQKNQLPPSPCKGKVCTR